MGNDQNEKHFSFFLQKYQKQILTFQKKFILTKYHIFWLSNESCSVLWDVSSQKRSFLAKKAVLMT